MHPKVRGEELNLTFRVYLILLVAEKETIVPAARFFCTLFRKQINILLLSYRDKIRYQWNFQQLIFNNTTALHKRKESNQ